MRWLPFEYAVRSAGRVPRRSVGLLVGAVFVFSLILVASAFVRGMEHSLADTGMDQNVILLGAGSEESIERSQIDAGAGGIAAASIPGLRSILGVPYVSPEVHTAMVVKHEREAVEEAQILVRGVTATAYLVHAQVRLTEGRIPRSAANEIIVGRMVARRLGLPDDGLTIGQSLWFGDRTWKIAGRFEAPGTAMDAEIWCDLPDLQIATKRDTSLSCVALTLGEGEFADVDAFCKQRLDLELSAIRERDYYAQLLRFFSPIRAMVWITAALVAVGGLLGGLNTMYAGYAPRIREFATLQALGFSRRAIVCSLLQESVLLTAAGALLACAVGLVAFDGRAVTFSLGAFGLAVDTVCIAVTLLTGIGLGILGTIPPAWRCLRLPVRDAVRIV